MTQKDKELLFKDLCARLPYEVKINVIYSNEHASSFRQRVCVEGDNELNTDIIWLYQQSEIDIKPYLFPLSSMTEEQYNELGEYLRMDIDSVIEYNKKDIKCAIPYFNVLDWYNKNHFDYRGLIPMGLAIDATGLNIY